MRVFKSSDWTGRAGGLPTLLIRPFPEVFLYIGYDDANCAYGLHVRFFGFLFQRWMPTDKARSV